VNPLLLAGSAFAVLALAMGRGGGRGGGGGTDLGLDLGADPDEPAPSKGWTTSVGGAVLPRAGDPLPPVAEGSALDVARWHADMDTYFYQQGVGDQGLAARLTYLPKARDVEYAIPDPRYWENMAYTLAVLRGAGFDLDAVETRGYRPPWYNEAVGGAPGSTHQWFSAIDLWPKATSVGRLHDLSGDLWAARRQADELGIGMYTNNVHVDTRRGSPAKWGSRKHLL